MRRYVDLLVIRTYTALPEPVRRFIYRWASPRWTVVARGVVVRSDGAVLLVRHHGWDRWSLPGGLIGRREAPVLAAIREIREETGVMAEPTGGTPTPAVATAERAIELLFPLRPRSTTSEARPASLEIAETGWFALTELPDLVESALVGVGTLVAVGSDAPPVNLAEGARPGRTRPAAPPGHRRRARSG